MGTFEFVELDNDYTIVYKIHNGSRSIVGSLIREEPTLYALYLSKYAGRTHLYGEYGTLEAAKATAVLWW